MSNFNSLSFVKLKSKRRIIIFNEKESQKALVNFVENGKTNEMRMKLFQKFMLTAKEIAAQIDLGYEKNKSTSGLNWVESIGLQTIKKMPAF